MKLRNRYWLLVAALIIPITFAGAHPGQRIIGDRADDSPTRQRIADDFAKAGLTDIAERRQKEVLEFVSAEALLTAMLKGGPVALAVKRFTPEVMAEVEQEFLHSVRDQRAADGRYFIPGEFVTVSGRRQ